MPQLLQPKQQLAGYEIGELVGKGGMGEVYRARQISMDRVVALKILAPRLAKQDPIFAKRFVDEARAAGRLNHPNIIAVHDVGKAPVPGVPAGSEPDLDYFSMEFVDGESVKDVIERQGICPLSLVTQVMQGMTEALVYAEAQGIVHRDIKPDNIMITNGGVVKLADLGLALQLGGEEVIGEKDGQGRSKVMGTPLYMSPEQARALPVDSRSDQYSLGATLFHMLTGKPPFKGDHAKAIMRAHVFDPIPDPKSINPEVPEGWRQLTMRLLAKTPEERFQNAVAMRAALQAAIAGHGTPGISRRVRANALPTSKDRASTMPTWAKGLVYGFIGAVVVMVLLFAIPWGSKPDVTDVKPINPLPPIQEDPKALEQAQIERVRRAISALSTDHEKAITTLDQLAQDKSIPIGTARDLLERERAARVTALETQRRKAEQHKRAEQARARQARVIELEQAWSATDLIKVKECLDYLTPELEKLSPSTRERVVSIKSQFGVALVDLQKSFTDQVSQARTSEALNELTSKVTDSALSEETKNSIRQMILKRAAVITPTKPAVPVDDRQQWQAFRTKLEDLRGGLTYGEIRQLADQHAAGFPSAEGKAHVQAISTLAKLATKAEGALRDYIKDASPHAEIAVKGAPLKVRLRSLDDKVGFTLQEGSGTAATSADRRNVTLPLRILLEKALEGVVDAAERPVMTAAMLWVWRSPDASSVFATIADHPCAKAVAEMERKTRILDVDARVVRTGQQVRVTYDGRENPWLVADFVGTGAQAVPQGLTWGTTKAVTAKAKEEELPTLRWKPALYPPFTLTTQVMIAPKTHLALIGISSGGHTIRLGFNNNNTRSQHTCVVVKTKDNGEGFQLTPGYSWYGQLDEPEKVEIRVDTDYRVSLRFKDGPFGEPLQMPTGGAIIPVFQILQLDAMETTFTVSSMTITGNLTPAE